MVIQLTLLAYLLVFLGITGECQAQRIIELKDALRIYQSDPHHALVSEVELESVTFFAKFMQNFSVDGNICYARDLAQYHQECQSQIPTDKWIVVNKFENVSSNDMIGDFGHQNVSNSTIKGLIFISDTDIKSDKNYTNPQIIARALQDKNSTFGLYASNVQNTNNSTPDPNNTSNGSNGSNNSVSSDGGGVNGTNAVSDPSIPTIQNLLESNETNKNLNEVNDTHTPKFWATLSHTFTARCYLLSDLYPLFYICSIIFLAVTLVWSAFVFVIRKNTAYSFQRLLTTIPILLLIMDFLYGKWYAACPWVDMTISTQAYLRMGKVVTVTFTFTFLHSLIYLICRGWKTTIHTVERNQATNITMVGSMFYLLYSAYFLSSDYQSITEFINIVLASVYFMFGLSNHIAISAQIRLVKQFLFREDDAVPASFQAAIRLKYKMLKQMRIFVYIFYFVRFLLYFFQGMNDQNTYAMIKARSAVAVIETFNFIFFLWIFRPRKQWPEFFDWRVGQHQLNQARNRQNAQNNRGADDPALAIKIQTAHITNKLLFGNEIQQEKEIRKSTKNNKNKNSFSSDGSFESFGSMDEDEPVIIVNPNCFTYQVDLEDQQFDQIKEDKLDESMLDFESQQRANYEIQSKISIAKRDAEQKKRTDAQKKNGTYKSAKDLQGSNEKGENKPKLKRFNTGNLFKMRNSLKSKSSSKKKNQLTQSQSVQGADMQHRGTVKNVLTHNLYPELDDSPLLDEEQQRDRDQIENQQHEQVPNVQVVNDLNLNQINFSEGTRTETQSVFSQMSPGRSERRETTLLQSGNKPKNHYFNSDYLSDLDE